MAKKKAEVLEVQEPVLAEEVQEADVVQIDSVEDISESDVSVEPSKEVHTFESKVAPTDVPTFAPTITEEVAYNPKDIVEFYNLKGDLRYAPYAYITKRGYTALRKYTKKK